MPAASTLPKAHTYRRFGAVQEDFARRLSETARHPAVRVGVWVLFVYVASRALVLLCVLAARKMAPGDYTSLMTVWDAGWMVQAAEFGYPTALPLPGTTGNAAQSTIGFFPGMPLAIRAVATATGQSFVTAGVAVSTFAGFLSTLLLFLFVRRMSDHAAAKRAALIYCFFPTSFIFLIVYSEGLMFVFAIACLWALVEQRWLAAGVLSALATAVRPTAGALVICCAWAAGAHLLKHRDPRALVAPLLAPLGMLSYFGWLWHHTGSATAWFTVQRAGWGQRSDLGVTTVVVSGRFLLQAPNPVGAVSSTVALAVAVAGIACMARWRPPVVLWIYTAVVLFLTFSTVAQTSRMRYLAAAFPLVMAVAIVDKRQRFFPIVLAVSAGSLCISTLLAFTTGAYIP